MARYAGFTLIELSIVLVIIGLMVGGILMGQDLIHAAEIRQMVSTVGQFQSAVRTFQSKYNCLPGDCPNASSFGIGTNISTTDGAIGTDGDGNGIIGDSTPGWRWLWAQSEMAFSQYHLYAAGLLSTVPTSWGVGIISWTEGFSAMKLSANRIYILGSDHNNNFDLTVFLTVPVYGASDNTCNGDFYCGAVTPETSWEMDRKMDDGFPNSGRVRELGTFTYMLGYANQGGWVTHSAGAPGPASNVCVNNTVTPNLYNVANTKDLPCLIGIDIN